MWLGGAVIAAPPRSPAARPASQYPEEAHVWTANNKKESYWPGSKRRRGGVAAWRRRPSAARTNEETLPAFVTTPCRHGRAA